MKARPYLDNLVKSLDDDSLRENLLKSMDTSHSCEDVLKAKACVYLTQQELTEMANVPASL